MRPDEGQVVIADEADTRAGKAGGVALSRPKTLIPQFALDAADGQIARIAGALNTVADTFEGLLDNKAVPLGDSAKEYVRSTADKIRGLGDRAGEQDAADILLAAQRAASDHPAVSAGLGAVIGASIGLALAALGARNSVSEADADQAQPAGARKKGVKRNDTKA